jgi:hypothetical protein
MVDGIQRKEEPGGVGTQGHGAGSARLCVCRC